MTLEIRKPGFGLYLHWPFCQSKCPYCDFNSHVSAEIDTDSWRTTYLNELHRYATETPDRTLTSIYFGGGTPSLMDPSLVEDIIAEAHKLWDFSNNIEITLEANPTSVEQSKFEAFRMSGVNRVSLGVQALDDTSLKRLGRTHSVKEALIALETARSVFERVSYDLIYARQEQTLDNWQSELNRALSFDPNHLSLYQLTIEPNTAFGKRFEAGKLRDLPKDDLAADMYFATQEITNKTGLPAYEVSNHAIPGQESRHNLIYWRGEDYLGIGPGAHGRITIDGKRFATETHLSPSMWVDHAKNRSGGESKREQLDTTDIAAEYLMMALRMSEGLDRKRFIKLSGQDFDKTKLTELSEMGLLKHDQKQIRATENGRAVLNAIICELLPD